jgi:ubiquinone/menaquinone biosynthesis C-methylase UbiE
MIASTAAQPTDLAPNHHANHPRFAGFSGLLAALSFTVGRGAVADLAVRLSRIGPPDDVVDVGCGPGVAVRHAAAAGASSVVGVDPAPVMLRVGRLLPGRRHAAVRYETGTAEALPLRDGTASALWSIATVHHWQDLRAGLAEARRVLRPAGRFLAIERRVAPGAHGHASHGWTEAQAHRCVEACRTAGFSEVELTEHRAGRKHVYVVRATNPST